MMLKTDSSSARRIASLAITLAIAAAAPCAAQIPLDVEHLALIREVTSAQIHPDGKLVAFTLRVPRTPGIGDDGPAWSELHVTDRDGVSRPFVIGNVNVGDVRWLPNGKAISFLARLAGDEHRCLYSIPVDGGQAQKILSRDTDIESYAWSPDGTLVFTCEELESEQTRKLRDLGFSQEVFEEDARPIRVYLAGPLGRGSEANALDIPGSAGAVAWSPDGKLLAVAMAPAPDIDRSMMFSRIHLLDAAAGTPVREIQTEGKLGAFVFSPDGDKLALIGAEDLNDPAEGRLQVALVGDGAIRDVLPNYVGHVQAIAWQDPDTIMFIAHEGCQSVFGEVRDDGTERKTHIPAKGPILTQFSLSKDGQSAAFVADDPAHPSELFVMQHGDRGPRRVTSSNPWLKNVRLAPQEVVAYESRDGVRLEGILVQPLDRKPEARYPLVLIAHGGPEAHFSNGWISAYGRPAQALAARGMAVFMPNYRGSTGRGVAFSKLGQHDYAGAEFDDLVDSIEHLSNAGLVDKTRVGITGGSYGGFAAAWGATKLSEHFAAAVGLVSMTDLVALAGSSDIAQEWNLVHARAWPWEDWNFFVDRSPLRYADQGRTPLLLAHGTSDTRIPPMQSLTLYRYLQVLGKAPVRLVRYPGEGHGNARAASRYDYSVRLIGWMEHYLKGPGGEPPAWMPDYRLDVLAQRAAEIASQSTH